MTEIHLPDRAPHEPWEPAPGVLVMPLRTPTLPPATHTNCVVLGDAEACVVVDPASPYRDEQERLEAALQGWVVEAIWLTHHHPDHVGGAVALRGHTGAPILAHPATIQRLPNIAGIEPLFEGDSLDLSGDVWEALHTPGHARGHLAFRDAQRRIVVAGDLVAGQGTIVIDPPEGDLVDYLGTLARLITEGVGPLIPAHGPEIPDGEAKLLEYIAHRAAREDQVLAELGKHAHAHAIDLIPSMYPEIPGYWHPLAARQVLAHLLKLEAEGRVVRMDATTGAPGTPVYMAAGGGQPDAAFRVA